METLWNRFRNLPGKEYTVMEDDAVALKEPLIRHEERTDEEDKYDPKGKSREKTFVKNIAPTYMLTVEPKFLRSPKLYLGTKGEMHQSYFSSSNTRSCFHSRRIETIEELSENALLRCVYLTLGFAFVLIVGVYQHAM